MSEDTWEEFAKADPYWAVLTDAKYRTDPSGALPPRERAAFFQGGTQFIEDVVQTIKTHFGRRFTKEDCCLDFGSGVGRLAIPMARLCGRTIGIDVSHTMRRICLQNAISEKLGNIECFPAVDHPALQEARFDWVNSYIVFQHIETGLGYRIFDQLLKQVKPGGAISVHFTTYKDSRVAQYLTDHSRYFTVDENGVRNVFSCDRYYAPDVMMMNDYDIGRLYMILGQNGFDQVLTRHEDQAGMHGLIFFSIKGPAVK